MVKGTLEMTLGEATPIASLARISISGSPVLDDLGTLMGQAMADLLMAVDMDLPLGVTPWAPPPLNSLFFLPPLV